MFLFFNSTDLKTGIYGEKPIKIMFTLILSLVIRDEKKSLLKMSK